MDPAIGSLVIVGLEAGKAGALAVGAHHAAKLLHELIGKWLGPSADLAGENLRRWFERRAEWAAGTITDASKMLADAGIEPHPVPGRILMPLLEAASMEENEDLHRQWAALLANGARPLGQHPVLPGYVEILRQLIPLQSEILRFILRNGQQDRQVLESAFSLGPALYAQLITDLDRLGLVRGPRLFVYDDPKGGTPWVSGSALEATGLSPLGMGFLQACTPPAEWK
jgi:hypothetical protein